MKNMKRVLSLALAVLMMLAVLAGCARPLPTTPGTTGKPNVGDPTKPSGNQPVEDLLVYAEGTELRIAAGYNKKNAAITFDTSVIGEGGTITLANGKTYGVGDLKPTWEKIEELLKVELVDVFTGAGSATSEFNTWKEKLQDCDLVVGTATQLTQNGAAGKMVNIAEYLDKMPNFRKYLEENPIVRLSITGDTSTGAIYFAPYFDGVNDIERMPLMRTDWVEKLLNGEGEFTAEACGNLKPAVYTPYMPTTGKVAIEVVKADGSAVENIEKDYDKAGNIVAVMNEALSKGTVTGVQAVNMLRKYIDEAYNGYYGTNRADLFIGQNAAWDADELVALLRCVIANAKTLNGTDTIQGLFSRNDDENKRRVDMFRFCGTLFGVRGLESRQDYLYVGADGKLHDARQEADTYEALARMNAMAQEGLIAKSFMDTSKESTKSMLENDLGFMHYDYNQTQTIYNETVLNKNGDTGEKYMAVLVPVARWYDGTDANGVYMRFTESWRSVKTDGWAISKAGVGNDQNKLYAALKLIDYAYSPEGQILMSYGPDEFIKKNADGSYVTFNFNGKQMPVIADATYTELWEKADGNYTNYARYYLGSTLSFVKSQAFEYQCTHIVGKEGAGHISVAIGLGVIKHPELAVTENPWYTIVPTVLPTTAEENTLIDSYTELTKKFGQANGDPNIFLELIVGTCETAGFGSAAEAAATTSGSMMGKQYLAIKQEAYERLLAYYESLQ